MLLGKKIKNDKCFKENRFFYLIARFGLIIKKNNLKNNIGRLTDNGLTDAVSDKPSPQTVNKNTLDAGSLIWRVVLQKLKAIFHISKK